jgi:uncharacterized protein DUF5071
MDEDIRTRLPKDKFDIESATSLVGLGYPTVAPILPELFAWITDINWPIVHAIPPFLSTIGNPPFLKSAIF